jgi:hypothetical protein
MEKIRSNTNNLSAATLAKMKRYATRLGCTIGDVYLHYYEFKEKYPDSPDSVALVTAYKRCINDMIELGSPVTGCSCMTIKRHNFYTVDIDELNI